MMVGNASLKLDPPTFAMFALGQAHVVSLKPRLSISVKPPTMMNCCMLHGKDLHLWLWEGGKKWKRAGETSTRKKGVTREEGEVGGSSHLEAILLLLQLATLHLCQVGQVDRL